MNPVDRLGARLGAPRRGQAGLRFVLRLVAAAVTAAVAMAFGTAIIGLSGEEHRFKQRTPVATENPREAILRMDIRTDTWRGEQFAVVWLDPLDQPRSLIPPGLARLPPPGGWAVSPGLARLMADQPDLLERYPHAAEIGPDGVRDPGELLAYRTLPAGGSLGPNAIGVAAFGGDGVFTIGSPSDLDVPPIALAASGLLLLPSLLLLGSAAAMSSPLRASRLAVLNALGMSRFYRARLVVIEAVPAALAGAAVGGAAYAAASPAMVSVPFVGDLLAANDVAASLRWLPVTLLGVVVIAAAAAITVDGLHRRAAKAGPRPLPPPVRLSAGRLGPLAAALLLFASSARLEGRSSAINALGGVLLLAVGVPLALPTLARLMAAWTSGRCLAEGDAAGLLAARRVQRDPAAAVRPLYGLAAMLIVVPVVAAWTSQARDLDVPPNLDPALQAVTVRGATDDLLRGGAYALPRDTAVMAVSTADSTNISQGLVYRLHGSCSSLSSAVPEDCAGGALNNAGAERLEKILGGALPVVLTSDPPPGDVPPTVAVIGSRSAGLEERVRRAALNGPAALSVLGEQDYVQRESVLVAWILGGVKAFALLLTLALGISALSRAQPNVPRCRLLRAVGMTRRQTRTVDLREVRLAYVVVAAPAWLAGVGAAWSWHRLSPQAPFPTDIVAALAALVCLLAVVSAVGSRLVAQDQGRPLRM